MQLKVGQLEEQLAKRDEDAVTAKLGEFEVSDDATELKVTSGVDVSEFTLDETANKALATYLKVPPSYFTKLTPDFRATLLRYEFERHQDAPTVVEVLNKQIIAFHQPNQLMLPLHKVAKVITKVFDPEDTIRRVISNDTRFHVDVTTDHHKVEFPLIKAWNDVTDSEQAQVGDITEAGLRFLAYPFKSIAPSATIYAERLICMNGQTVDERLGRISLQGRTVDDVIAEMEQAAEHLLGQLDDHLDRLASTRNMYPPGTPQAFAEQLAREANVSRKVLDAVFDIINQLPTPVSIWEVNQAFTTVANQSESYATRTRLQTLGGHLAFDAEKMIERCGTCERLL